MTREWKIEMSTRPRGTNRGAAGFIDAAQFTGGRIPSQTTIPSWPARRTVATLPSRSAVKKPAPGRPDVLSQPKLLRHRLRDKCRIPQPTPAKTEHQTSHLAFPSTHVHTNRLRFFVFANPS